MNTSLMETLGQHLIIGFEAEQVDNSVRKLLDTYRPAGVILFARNLRTAEQTAQLVRDLYAHLPHRPFLSIDEEGGTVDRLKKFLPPLPSAESVARTGKPSLAHQQGDLIGAALRLLGFNLDFAPVLDLRTHTSREALAQRTFGDDPTQVTEFARSFIEGLKRHRILPCGKHFPGLGKAGADTHFHLPLVDEPMVGLWQQDMVPYRRLAKLLPLVLVGHACYKAYDFQTPVPASLSSRIIRDLLRQKMNYQGLVVTDDLEMGAITDSVPLREIGVRALEAGCDLLIVSRRERSIHEIMTGLEKAASKGSLDLGRLKESRARIARLRRGLAAPPASFNANEFAKLTQRFRQFSEQVQEAEVKLHAVGW